MKVAIITEGYQGIGYGHLTRCLSIYQAFEEKGITPIYIANCDEEGKKFIPNVNLLQFNWIENIDELLNRINNYDIVIIDSYLAPFEVYERVYNSVKKVVYIDDYIRLNYPPGIIVNATIGAENLPYKKDEKHKYLFGIEYIPLRKEFWDVEIHNKNINKVENILITFGAQDIRNLTPQVLLFLNNEFPKMTYNVVVNQNFKPELEKVNITYYQSLSAKEMLKVMLKSDFVVTAAGQTTYELARIGLPTVAIGVAENQKFNLKGWWKIGLIQDEIWAEDNNMYGKLKRSILSIKQVQNKVLLDGQGARRIVNICINNE